ncbi:GntR family transcriptional regulator [Bailinhaonella thermotolerans]|uniref:GntR family transcriptional regulator n=1 Tax=Bailinhaonella thermotolerans TaxID=1070861 RepID=A0A3A4B2B6_9ACTN|nr:GntR family transcriptional regulator [Bailinhaonella thermotolerans]
MVDDVAATCEEQPGVSALRLDYDHESQAPAIVEAHSPSVEGWLFTGIVPYMLARGADVLTRPAAFVDYTGATLLSALVRLQREGQDVTRLSIDTLPAADVTATFAEAGLPTEDLRVLPYRPEMTSMKAAAFHRRGARHPVITCLSSVYEELRDDMHVLRLAPSVHSVRVALRQLLLTAEGQAQEDAQIALGLVEVENQEGLLREATALGGTVAAFRGGTHLLVTTRGPLHDATGGFSGLPMLARLAAHNRVVRVGFGLGRSAAEAESLARRALARARRIGDVAAVLSLRADTDIVLESVAAATPGEQNLAVIARRVGLSVATLEKLLEAREAAAGEPLTTREIAERLAVQQRTARRMLHRLELAGLAERTGNLTSGSSGRPLTLYRLTL